jgi:hypothetical protein
VVIGDAPAGLPSAEQKLLAVLAGQEPLVRDVLRQSGYAEFEGLRLLYQLKEQRLIRFETAVEADIPGNLGQILQIFNGALKVLYEQVSERNPRLSEEVRSFLRNLPQPFSFVFRDVVLRNDGTLDGARLLANLSGLGQGDKERLLVDAVNELIYMECLVARRELGVEQSAVLLQRVQEISRRVKGLIGRER